MPTYRELGRNRGGVPLFFLSPEPVETVRGFLTAAGVRYDGIVTVDFREAGIASTPTLAIIDSYGTVKEVFYGKLAEKDAAAVRALVNRETL